MNEAWEDTQSFIRREAGLLLPLALATLGGALLIYALIVPRSGPEGVPPGAWMLGLLPALLLFAIGSLAISALVVLPRLSVAEALRVAGKRLLPTVLLLLGIAAAFGLLLLLFSLVGVALGAAFGWGQPQSAALAVAMLFPLMLWASVRLLPVWPLLVERGDQQGVAALVRASLALTRGVSWRLLAVMLLFMIASILVSSAIQFAFGSILMLAARALGSPDSGRLLVAVLMAIVNAMIQTVWIVFIAQLYRRLSATKGM